MALAFVNSATAAGAATNSLSVSVPTSTVTGNVMVLFVGSNGAQPNTPAGWILITAPAANGKGTLAAYFRVANSEPASYTITASGSTIYNATILTYSGCGGVDVFTSQATTSAVPNIPSVTTTETNELVLLGGGFADPWTQHTVGGTTLRATCTGSSTADLQVCELSQAAAGATGATTWGSTSDTASVVILVALLPGYELTGSMAGTATMSGGLKLGVSGTMAGAAAMSAPLLTAIPLTASAAAASASMTAAITERLTGTMAAGASMTANLTLSGVTGTMAGTASMSATLVQAIALSGTMAGGASMTANLLDKLVFTGTMLAGASMTGFLYAPVALSGGTMAAGASMQGAVNISIGNPSGYLVTIGGVALNTATRNVEAGTLDILLAIGKRSTARFTTNDFAGTLHWKQNTRVVVSDPQSGAWIFSGFVDDPIETKPSRRAALLQTDTLCKDNHWLADKRVYAAAYSNQSGDSIVMDVFDNILQAEGCYVIKNLFSTNQSNVETGTTGFTSINSATLTQTSAQSWQGTDSLSVVTPGSVLGEGVAVLIASSNMSDGQIVTVSAYVLAPIGQSMTMWLWQQSPSLAVQSAVFIGTGGWQRISITAALPDPLIATNYGLRLFPTATAAITFYIDGCQFEPNAVATAWELGQTSSVASAPIVAQETFNYAIVSSILDTIAADCNYWWIIDQYCRLWFQPYGAFPAPYIFDGTMAIYKPGSPTTSVETQNPKYMNTSWLIGATDVTSAQTETRAGDGKTTAWAMRYPLAKAPSSITVNAVSKTIGIKGVSTGKDWYWAKGDPIIAQDSAGTVLATTDTLSVTYVGEFPTVVKATNTSQITQEQMLEGIGTGIVETTTNAPQITTAAAGQSAANALLERYAAQGQLLTYDTYRLDQQPGQLLALAYAPHGLSGNALIESVEIKDSADGLNLIATVMAIIGPYDVTWVDFYAAIIKGALAPPNEQTNASSNATIIVPVSFTMTWPIWTMTATTATYVCPVPSTTTYPSTTLYPC